MKIVIILPFVFAMAGGQFHELGGFADSVVSGLADVFKLGVDITSDIAKLPGAVNLPFSSVVDNFADFAAQTGKKYISETEKILREGIFEANRLLVGSHNELFKAGKSLFEMGLNFMADLKPEEYAIFCGRKKSDLPGLEMKHERPAELLSNEVPDSFDWREMGGVTPVKAQGAVCQCCWTFATTGAIEGHNFRKTGKLVPLSEQNLIDCSKAFGNTGCNGGWHNYGFEYVAENHGISEAERYPYIEKEEKCHYRKSNRGAAIEAYASIPPGNETLIKAVVATLGPVAASMDADHNSFKLYNRGIYDNEKCNTGKLNHDVLIVGYGSEKGRDYWIVKNSWGEQWGENGYVRMLRNANSFCGIATDASYPIV